MRISLDVLRLRTLAVLRCELMGGVGRIVFVRNRLAALIGEACLLKLCSLFADTYGIKKTADKSLYSDHSGKCPERS